MPRSTSFKLMGGTLIFAGLWTGLLPFVGPVFGYGMPPGADVPAWEWNASNFQRHVLPGVAAILAGALFLTSNRRIAQTGAWLALLAGIWMIVNPFVVRAWLEGGGGGGAEPSTLMQIITPLGYHYVPGIVTLGLAALALGLLSGHRVQAPPLDDAAPREDEHARSAARPRSERRMAVGAPRR